MKVHPTAIVSKKARLGKDVCLGPYTVIGDGVLLGKELLLVRIA